MDVKSTLGRKLVSIAVENPYLIIVGCFLIVIIGGLSLIRLPKDLLPAANMPAIQILSFYPGMPVEDVDKNLTARFERYTGQAIGLQRQESKSLVGVSIVKNFFSSDSDLNTAISQTTSLVMSVLRKLPPGTQPPLILPFDPMASQPLALVAVDGNENIEKIYDTARYDVRDAIQAVPGAMAPTVMGGTQREVVIFLDPEMLKKYNFSPLNALDILSHLDTFIPSGDVKIGPYDYQIESNALVDHVDEMNNFPLRADNGVTVYLKDIGHAQDSGQIQTNVVMINGKEQVYVPVYRQPGGNSIRVVDQVKAAIQQLQKQFDGSVKLSVVADQSIFIRHAISSITEEAFMGGGLAAIMIFLFLASPRATMGIFLSLPLSLLVAFIGLSISKQTINVMTLGGLALAIGVLVDNSIVVLENISKKLESGLAPRQAAFEGAAEVAMPVLSATLATMVVFFPVIFLTGIVNILFSALAKSVIFAMIGSFFISMTVMPLFSSHFLRAYSDDKPHRFFIYMRSKVDNLTDFYGKMLLLALQYRNYVLSGVVILFIIAASLTPLIGTELFPKADSGNFILNMRLASGTRIEQTAALSQQIEAELRQLILPKDLQMIITNAGVYYGFPAAFTPNVGTQDVFFDVELTKDRTHTSQYYAKRIRSALHKSYPDVTLSLNTGGLLTSALNEGLRAPIDIQIEGSNMQKSYNIALDLAKAIKKIPGAVDTQVQERFDAPIIDVNIDRDKSMSLGITTEDIIKNLVSAVSGSATFDSSDIWVDPKTGIDYPMAVQIAQSQVSTFFDLANTSIRGQDQQRVVPLSWLANLSQTKGPTQINEVNYRPVIDIYLDAQGRSIGSVAADIQKIIEQYKMPEGYTANLRGEVSEMKDSIHSLGGGFLLAAILVYLILVVQFKSFLTPLIIMMSVPLGLIGIIFMLIVTDTYFSIQAAIGSIFMIGIAVANGVLLIEFISHHVKLNNHMDTGIVAGAQKRLRPILMTSLAAILALIPMAIGIGHGSEANIPLGRAVIGGQLCSTLLTLFVVPILYRCLMRRHHEGLTE